MVPEWIRLEYQALLLAPSTAGSVIVGGLTLGLFAGIESAVAAGHGRSAIR